MSRRTVTLPHNIIPDEVPDISEEPEDALIVASDIRDFLMSVGCCPAGTKEVAENRRDKVRDPEWGGDLVELVARATPHEIQGPDGPETVSVRLDTLTIEYDDNMEIRAWMYEEW